MRHWCCIGVVLLTLAGCGGRTLSDGHNGLEDPNSPQGGVAAGGTASGSTTSGGTASGSTNSGATGGEATGGQQARDCGSLISDLEDATGHICTGNGRLGVWYAYKDDYGTQWPAPTTPGTPIPPTQIPGERQGSRWAMYTEGRDLSGWGAGIGLDLNFDGTTYERYDASEYAGISFWAKSNMSTTILVSIGTDETTAVEYGGSCEDQGVLSQGPWICDPYRRAITLGPSWSMYQIHFTEFELNATQRRTWGERAKWFLERSALTNIQFHVPDSDFAEFEFWIDDVSFVRESAFPSCCPTPPDGCEGFVTFADPGLEEAVRERLGLRQGDLNCESTCVPDRLYVVAKAIQRLDGIECLVGLRSAVLSGNQIRSLAPLASLTQLSDLDLRDNAISDLSPLESLEGLEQLYVGRNAISDLSPLESLDELRLLDVSRNAVHDLSPLLALTELDQVRLWSDPIDCSQQAANVAALESRGVIVWDSRCP